MFLFLKRDTTKQIHKKKIPTLAAYWMGNKDVAAHWTSDITLFLYFLKQDHFCTIFVFNVTLSDILIIVTVDF
jgi:hypothetical protein